MENELTSDAARRWRKLECLGYILTTLTVPIYFYYVMIHLEGRRDETALWFWVVTLGLWYSGFILSGFARYKKHDHTPASIFLTALGILGPLIIYYL